jgi:hypothetical protein
MAAEEALAPALLRVAPGDTLASLSSALEAALRGRDLRTPPLTHALAALAAASPQPRGMALEFGVGHGGTLRCIAGAAAFSRVVGFDSFQGLPENWLPEWPKASFSRNGVPPHVPGAELVSGPFSDTVRPFLETLPADARIRLVHIDCDLYSSTATVLTALAQRLATLHSFGGGSGAASSNKCADEDVTIADADAADARTREPLWLVFDELRGYPGSEAHELRALYEMLRDSGMAVEVVGSDQRPLREGDAPLRFFGPHEACPHRVAMLLHPPAAAAAARQEERT